METKRKRAKVVMLPTEGLSNIAKFERRLEYCESLFSPQVIQTQYLYFTTDDEIKKGDWCYDKTSNVIRGPIIEITETHYTFKGSSTHNLKKHYSKIIATTDPKLTIQNSVNSCDGCIADHAIKEGLHIHPDTGSYYMGCQKDKYIKQLSKPSQAFIEKYCKLGGIDEVDVEYIFEGSFDTNQGDWKLKIDSHNTITIHSIKDSWNKEEVEQLCRSAMFVGELLGRNPLKPTPLGKGFDEISFNWIKENL
jgi:hypothetical protein